MLFGQGRMQAPTLFRAHRVQLSRESLPVGPALDDEAAVSTARTLVRKAEEGKRLGPPVAAALSQFGGEPAELEETRFLVVEHQAERG